MIVDIHPEDLIDKCAARELTLTEHERLEAHLTQCASCRFEIAARADLAMDTSVVGARPQLGLETGSTALSDALRVPVREGAASQRSRTLRPRARRRWPVVLLAASFVLCAGGAAAAVLTGSVPPAWIPWSPQPKSGPVVSTPAGARRAHALGHARADAPPNHASPSETAVLPPTLPLAPVAELAPTEGSAVTEASSLSRAISSRAPLAKSSAVRGAALAPEDSVPIAPPPVLRGSTSPSDLSATLVETPVHGADAAGVLFAEANSARRAGNAEVAGSLYSSLQRRYPNSAESDLSRAVLAQMQLERGSPAAALAGFDRYLAGGSTALSAEALVGRAHALEQLGKRDQAVVAWTLVQRRFAGSVHAQLAATRLAALSMR